MIVPISLGQKRTRFRWIAIDCDDEIFGFKDIPFFNDNGVWITDTTTVDMSIFISNITVFWYNGQSKEKYRYLIRKIY